MKKIGFIGAGNMATAIIDGIIRNDSNSADFITVYDVMTEKLDIIAEKGVMKAASAAEVVAVSDITVLAVKPQNYPEVLESIKEAVNSEKIIVTTFESAL